MFNILARSSPTRSSKVNIAFSPPDLLYICQCVGSSPIISLRIYERILFWASIEKGESLTLCLCSSITYCFKIDHCLPVLNFLIFFNILFHPLCIVIHNKVESSPPPTLSNNILTKTVHIHSVTKPSIQHSWAELITHRLMIVVTKVVEELIVTKTTEWDEGRRI